MSRGPYPPWARLLLATHDIARSGLPPTIPRTSRGAKVTIRPGTSERPDPLRDPGAHPRLVLPVVLTEVVLLQRHGLAAAGAERVVRRGTVVAAHGVHGGLGLLGRLHPDVAVLGHARAGRDELTDDDVLLQAQERVGLGVDRRVRQDPGRLLEGGRRQPGLGGQRRLGDAHEHRASGRRGAALGDGLAVDLLEPRPLDELTGQQVGVTGLQHVHALEHLPHDYLDVLVVDRHTLRAVDLLDLRHQVQLHGPRAEDAQHLVRVDRTGHELLAHLDVVAVEDQQARPHRDRVGDLLGAVVRDDDDLARLVRLVDADPALRLGDRGDTLGDARLEQLLDSGQTVGDVGARHTTGVEGTHRQLRAGLTDRLGGDDADRLADVHELAGRQRTAVAGGADTDLRLADERTAGADGLHAGLDQLGDVQVVD